MILRAAGALGIAAAVLAQWRRTQENEAAGTGETSFVSLNFFSFFTIESNVFAALVLGIGFFMMMRRGPEPKGFTLLRAIAVTYMATTGIVYNLLLRGIELPQGATVAWSNEVLHLAGPLLVVLDWLIAPGKRRLEPGMLWPIVAFPVIWAGYTLIRGALVLDPRTGSHWYPYPFLNPAASANGYFSVAFYVLLIAVMIWAVGALVLRTSRRLRIG
ncbi:Pr6Pr family membrane protein [Paeniglutamicibacter cryotolerans]|nr:Pr6Pr family membrane protein [Paeniglutamicibacter cryotolerans]